MAVEVDVNIDDLQIMKMLNTLQNDKVLGYAIHDLLAKKLDPYVPMDEGVLAQSVIIQPDKITYAQPYAHYMYEGVVYGANIPIIENGMIVGWFSLPNVKKHPTGDYIEYNTEKHPLATDHWDRAMMEDVGDDFLAGVKDLIIWRANQLL